VNRSVQLVARNRISRCKLRMKYVNYSSRWIIRATSCTLRGGK